MKPSTDPSLERVNAPHLFQNGKITLNKFYRIFESMLLSWFEVLDGGRDAAMDVPIPDQFNAYVSSQDEQGNDPWLHEDRTSIIITRFFFCVCLTHLITLMLPERHQWRCNCNLLSVRPGTNKRTTSCKDLDRRASSHTRRHANTNLPSFQRM